MCSDPLCIMVNRQTKYYNNFAETEKVIHVFPETGQRALRGRVVYHNVFHSIIAQSDGIVLFIIIL